MRYTELASRYANALFDLAIEAKQQEEVFAEIREINKVYDNNNEVTDFMKSPLIKPSEKLEAMNSACAGKGLSSTTENFIFTLAQKNRLELFPEVVLAYQARSDEANGVSRGQVTSSAVLAPEEREEIEQTVRKVTGKKVILSYKEDTNLIGGLIAEVGSYTFDDTLTSHLKRLQEDMKRRAH